MRAWRLTYRNHEGHRTQPSVNFNADDLRAGDAILLSQCLLDFRWVDHEAAKAHRVAHAGEVNETAVFPGVTQVARAEVPVLRECLRSCVRIVVVAHEQGRRADLDLARHAVRADLASLRIARAHADRRAAHRLAAAEHTFVQGQRGILDREQRVDFARAVQATERKSTRDQFARQITEAGAERGRPEHAQMRERNRYRHDRDEAPKHFVTTEHVRDPVLRHQPTGLVILENVHHDDRYPACHGAKDAVQAENAAQGQGGEQRVAGFTEAKAPGHVLRVLAERSLRVHDQFGSAGGARCGEKNHGRIGIDGCARHGIGLGLKFLEAQRDHRPSQNGIQRPVGCIDFDHARQAGQRRGIDSTQDLREVDLVERRLQHQHRRLSIREDIVQLVAAVSRVDGHQGRADLGQPEQQCEPLDAVHDPDGDFVAGAHAMGRHPGGSLRAQPVELCHRDPVLALDDHRVVGRSGEPVRVD